MTVSDLDYFYSLFARPDSRDQLLSPTRQSLWGIGTAHRAIPIGETNSVLVTQLSTGMGFYSGYLSRF